MTAEQSTVFAILAAVMALLIWGRWRYDMVAFAALLVAVVAGAVVGEGAVVGGAANPFASLPCTQETFLIDGGYYAF